MFHPFSSEKSPFLSSTSISSVPSLGSAIPRAHHVHGMAVQVRHGAVVQLLGGVLLGAKAAQVVADHLGAPVRYKLPYGNLT